MLTLQIYIDRRKAETDAKNAPNDYYDTSPKSRTQRQNLTKADSKLF